MERAPVYEYVRRLQNGICKEAGVQEALVDLRFILCIPRCGQPSLSRSALGQNRREGTRSLTFHVVILLSFPIGLRQLRIQASSVWFGFCWKQLGTAVGISLATYMVLVEDNRPLGVQPYCEQRCKHFPPRSSERLWVLRQCQSVPSDDRVQQPVLCGGFVLELDPVCQGTQIVA